MGTLKSKKKTLKNRKKSKMSLNDPAFDFRKSVDTLFKFFIINY